MNIRHIDLREDRHYQKNIRNLYYSAFPKSERVPWWLFSFTAKFGCKRLTAYLDGDRFCGFTYHIFTKSSLLVLFFAVDENCRGCGYGSAILQYLRKTYPNRTLLLHVEPPLADAPNLDERLHRIAFYQKNGFMDTGFTVTEIGGDFRIFACGERVDIISEYKKVFRALSAGLWNVRVRRTGEIGEIK